jgi:hypothetical protein
MAKYALIEGTAVVAATAAAAGVAAGTVAAARGDSTGAPGISRALSRLGRLAGGGMLAGVAVAGSSAALASLVVYQGIRLLEARLLR